MRALRRAAAVLLVSALALQLVTPNRAAAVGDSPRADLRQRPGADDSPRPPLPGGLDLDPSSLPSVRAAAGQGKHPKLESTLLSIGQAARVRGPAAVADEARARGVTIVQDRARVVVEAAAPGASGAEAAVAQAGGTVEAVYGPLVQALLPLDTFEAVANHPAVQHVRQPFMAEPEAVAGEGVTASGANVWHAAGITGAGVKVGIIDNGFTGYRTRQANGDLPQSLTVVDFCGGNVEAPGGDHGTAVAEIVHEMAPSAQLYLLCIETEVQLGQAKDYAKANGIQILSVSLGYFNTSRGDGSGGPGTPDAIAADARDSGILWVNSAGNYAPEHWGGSFSDADGDGWHAFLGTDETQEVYVPFGDRICANLKWDTWPTTNQDFDLYLFRSSTGALVALSDNEQSGSQPPTERLCYDNVVASGYFSVAIRKYSATMAPRMDLFTKFFTLEYPVAATSLNDVAGSPKAFAVGAVCWQTNVLEPFSSQGPTIDGRIKPDIAGQDRVSSGTDGSFTGCDGSGGFIGTSAAQPHVAGAAALVKQANPSFGPAQLQAFLEGRAVDQGASGKDNQFGSGRLALGAPPSSQPPPPPPPPPVSCSPRPPVTVTASPSGGRLVVTLAANGANNTIRSVRFGTDRHGLVNALVDLPNGQSGLSGPFTHMLNTPAPSFTFSVRRAQGGQATTVPMIVTDGCGAWETFVGGGTQAGF